jgi:endonuclease YncB( thermonuclease family)
MRPAAKSKRGGELKGYPWVYALALAIVCCLSGPLTAFTQTQHQDADYYKVRWVADGDTLILEDGRKIRFLGINAPETAHDGLPAQPFGRAAQRYNRRLAENQMVRLEFDQERHDRFGRWLAHVYRRDGLWLNREMVAKGLAIYLYTPKNRKHGGKLLSAQREAMESRVGLWQPGPQAPLWQGRYLGNRRSQRFHRVNCRFGRRTSRRNQVWFDSQWAAYHAGYAPGSKCLGRTPGALPDAQP